MSSEGYRPAEAAASLGIPASTLRLYSVRFARLLSESAAAPVERGGGKPGYRLYSERDLALLREGKDLLAKGLTYDEALRELRRRWAPRTLRSARVAAPREREEPTAVAEAGEGAEAPRPAVESAPQPARGEGGLPAPAMVDEAGAVRGAEWALLTSNLLASLGSAQAVAEEWRRIVEERNAEIANLREQIERLAEERRRPWWRLLFGG